MKHKILVVKAAPFAGFCYSSPRKLGTEGTLGTEGSKYPVSLSHAHMGRDGIENTREILFQSPDSASYLEVGDQLTDFKPSLYKSHLGGLAPHFTV